MGRVVHLVGRRNRREAASGPEISGGVSPDAVEAQLQKILGSELFVHSDRLSRLLRFVVAETLLGRGDQLKEHYLGLAVFDRGDAYDPRTDPIVRVEAGRLRGKLKEYYGADGIRDPVLIELPKGSYAVAVRSRGSGPSRLAEVASRFGRRFDARIVALLAAGVIIGILFFQNRSLERQLERPKQLAPELAAVWGPFFSSRADTVVVFGSPLFFESEDQRLFVRPYSLNDPTNLQSQPDYQNMQKLVGPLSGPRYDYAQMGDAIALHQLSLFFGSHGKSLKAVPANLATWESIKDGNIIFLGAPRMNPLMQRLPVQLDFEIGPNLFVTNRNPQPGEEKVYYTPSHRDKMSYAVIASLPGLRPGSEILVLTSHGSAGIQASVDYITHPDTLRELTHKLKLTEPAQHKSYQVLLRVFADRDEPVKVEYVTHHAANRGEAKP